MQAAYVNINGKLLETETASVPHDNRAFRYGHGLFETMLFQDGEIELKEYHTARLFKGAKQLCFHMPVHMNAGWLEDEIKRTVSRNKLDKICRVRLQLFAGSGGIFENRDMKPSYVIECFTLDEHIIQLNEQGLVLGIAKDLKKSIDSLSNLKSSNALVYAMAAQQAKENQWNDALVRNTNDNIIESAIANLFIIKGDIIQTPPLAEGCVAGVMRRWLLEQLLSKGYTVIESAITENTLLQADEVFLTNAIRRIKWVSSIADKSYNCKIVKSIHNTIF